VVLSPPKVSAAVRQMHPEAVDVFRDAYNVEFLGLPREHTESDLHHALLNRMKDFLLELGRDFCFIGSEFPVQVGKQQTAKEAIAANVQALIEQLEQGHSEGLTAYLSAMGRFHNYSFGNILEIARQKPNATRVAGLHAWNQLGRKVKKGERGIRILAPVIGVHRKKDAEAEKGNRDQNQTILFGFRSAYVFDVSQTEGKDLPQLSERVTGDVGESRERLVDFILAQGIPAPQSENAA
jgi:hypothetical protein